MRGDESLNIQSLVSPLKWLHYVYSLCLIRKMIFGGVQRGYPKCGWITNFWPHCQSKYHWLSFILFMFSQVLSRQFETQNNMKNGLLSPQREVKKQVSVQLDNLILWQYLNMHTSCNYSQTQLSIMQQEEFFSQSRTENTMEQHLGIMLSLIKPQQ